MMQPLWRFQPWCRKQVKEWLRTGGFTIMSNCFVAFTQDEQRIVGVSPYEHNANEYALNNGCTDPRVFPASKVLYAKTETKNVLVVYNTQGEDPEGWILLEVEAENEDGAKENFFAIDYKYNNNYWTLRCTNDPTKYPHGQDYVEKDVVLQLAIMLSHLQESTKRMFELEREIEKLKEQNQKAREET